MTREEMMAKGWTPAETKKNGQRRARWHDYNLPGIYMLTLVTDQRRRVFGSIEGRSRAAKGTPEYPHLRLSALGKRVLEEEVAKIHRFYPMVEVWKATLMPDHIHLLVCVREPLPEGKHLGLVVSGFKAGCTQAWWREGDRALGSGDDGALGRTLGNGNRGTNGNGKDMPEGQGEGTVNEGQGEGTVNEGQGGDTVNEGQGGDTVNEEQGGGTVNEGQGGGKVNEEQGGGKVNEGQGGGKVNEEQGGVTVPEGSPEGGGSWRPVLFQRGYHDRIIRDRGMLDNIHRYMDENPFRACIRAEIPQLMERRLHLWIHDHEYAAFGNLFLLKNPEKIQVFFHRKNAEGIQTHLTPEYAKERNSLLLKAEEGAVLVTPGISKGEQGIVAEALSRQLPLIILQKEAISEFWKPPQSRFYACASGHLLILAPWRLEGECDYERFHNLNDQAREICMATDTRILGYSSFVGRMRPDAATTMLVMGERRLKKQ